VPTYILEDGHRAELRQDVYYFIQTIEWANKIPK
jgi:hypothetical protein